MKIILSLFFVLLHSVLSYAYNQFSFVKYQVENGLSHNTVWYTIQDHQGFMWFGTSDGLNRFDGKNFKIFRHIPKDSTSLGNNIVRTIFEDERQNLWVGTNRGIYIFNSQQEEFEFFDNKTEDGVLISSNVYDIEQSHDGSIWIATFGQGLFIYTPQTNTLIQNTQHSSFIKSITSSGSGDMYIGTRQEGIICFAPNGIYKRSFSPDLQTTEQNNETNALYYYNDTLWFSLGTNSLNMLDLKSNRIHTFPTQFGTTNVTNIRSILVYSDTELLVGADNGLYLFNRTTHQFLRMDDPSNPKSLSDQSIFNIFKDREIGRAHV